MASIKKGTIFRRDKNLRVAIGPIARLGANTVSDKKIRPNANFLLNKKRDLSLKSEKGFTGA